MKKVYLLLLVACLGYVACKKLENKHEDTSTNQLVLVDSMSKIKVPAGFKWETSRDVSMKIGTTDARFPGIMHKVVIYNGDPMGAGVEVGAGAVTSTSEFSSTINLANTINDIYLLKIAPDQSRFVQHVDIKNNAVVTSMYYDPTILHKSGSGPDCSTGCTSAINNATGLQSFSSGVRCFTGAGINISKLTISGTAVVRICGSGSIDDIEFSSSTAQLIITGTGNITFTKTIPIDEGSFVNYGIVKVPGNSNFNINSTANFENNGTVTVGKDFNPNGSCIITNNATIEVGGKLINSSGCTFTNNCKLIVHNDFQNNGTFYNYGYIKCDMESTVDGGSNQMFKQYNGAMLYTQNIQVNGTISGTGSTSLIKVIDQSKGNSQGVVSGSQSYCDLNGIETAFKASINSGATQSCSLYVPVTACNPAGNGSVAITDSDHDGVADSSDCYPNDATKAFCNRYGTATVAFEDLWPSKGDYDMNDVVVNYNYNVITNASNNVVRVEATYILRATGGSFNNGFAVQFPVNRSSVSEVSGATLEAGQSKAVLVMFTNMRAEMNYWNTIRTQPVSQYVTYNVSFNISNGPSFASFGLGAYNPFIYNGTTGFGRGYEVHLYGKMPTDLANSSLFGTYDDATNLISGDTYVSKNGRFPWAINIPVSFDYPVEKADINSAYLRFATWVSSGGNQYNDWYTNQPGYRNSVYIY